jgi:cytochrome b6-f complex iron-sulfur subunit
VKLREIDRRSLLAGAGALVGLSLPALRCSGDAEPPLSPGQIAVPLSDLPDGRRHVVMLGENPVEVLRSGDSVTALMLRCTHMGCVVRWNSEYRIYVCPCHDSRYDAEGRVLSGPPPGPLHTVRVSIQKGRAVLG